MLKDIPNESVDLILCDLPYGTTGSSWDKVIDPAELWEHYRRVTKPTGTIVLFATEPFATTMRAKAMDLYKYDWIWHKNTVSGFAHAKNMPLRNYENIMVFSKGKVGHESRLNGNRMTYNPQGLRDCIEIDHANHKTETMHSGTFMNNPNEKYIRTKTGYPRMVLNYASKAKDKKLHINAKPVDLLEYLIRTYTNEGETVLDNCMGSGSTGVACVNTGRNFIGMELDDNYFDIAKKRIGDGANGNKI